VEGWLEKGDSMECYALMGGSLIDRESREKRRIAD